MSELTVVCERCLKYASTELVQTAEGGYGTPLWLVTCHGQTRMVSQNVRSATPRVLWEHLYDHTNSIPELVASCNAEIARLQRLVAAARKVTNT